MGGTRWWRVAAPAAVGTLPFLRAPESVWYTDVMIVQRSVRGPNCNDLRSKSAAQIQEARKISPYSQIGIVGVLSRPAAGLEPCGRDGAKTLDCIAW